jgi:hypothetical protein
LRRLGGKMRADRNFWIPDIWKPLPIRFQESARKEINRHLRDCDIMLRNQGVLVSVELVMEYGKRFEKTFFQGGGK